LSGTNAILKAQSNADAALLDAAAEISAVGGDTFTLKVVKFDLDVRTPLLEATQEADSAVSSGGLSNESTPYIKYKHTGKVGGTAKLEGLIVTNQAVGLNSLPDEEVDVKVYLGKDVATGNKHSVAFRMAIEQLQIRWSRQQVGVPVVVVGKITNRFGNTGSNSVLEAVAS
jgi:hypothetical protein